MKEDSEANSNEEDIGTWPLPTSWCERAAAPYTGGRSAEWIKGRIEHRDDFAVVGFTEPKGSRSGLGSGSGLGD